MTTASETAPTASNPLNLFLNIWTSPVQAYRELQLRPRLWYPLLAVVGLQIAVVIFYSFSVDFAWMMEQTMAASGRDISPEQREAMQSMSGGDMGRIFSAVFGSLAIMIIFPLIFAVAALYYWVISLFTADGNRYGQWYGFVCWSSTPMIFAALASLVSIWLNDNGQILQTELNPLSLNSLIFDYRMGEPGFTFLSSIDLTMLWSLGLNIVGYKVWTNKSTGVATLIACAPFVLVLGIFGFFSFT